MFLVVVDAFSKWPEIVQMRTTTTTATIKELGKIFSQHGYPKMLVSDNGTQFASKEFEEYCQSHGINHVRSPPYQPHCNGQAERFVDTFKRALRKLQGEGATADVLQKFLLTYRTTPLPSSEELKTPAELLLGRQLRIPLTDLQLNKFHHQDERSRNPVLVKESLQNKMLSMCGHTTIRISQNGLPVESSDVWENLFMMLKLEEQ